MSRYMETLFLGSGGDGFETLVGAEYENSEATTKAFYDAKEKYEMDIKIAPFLLDLKEEDGEVVDTFGLSDASYTELTGEPSLNSDEYMELDKDYWDYLISMDEYVY